MWEYFQNHAVENFTPALARLNFLFREARGKYARPGGRVLNVGVGNGWLEKICAERGWETHSLDPSETAVKKLAPWGVTGRPGYISDIPYPDNFFDTVFCTEVIEHLALEQLERGLREIARVLRDSGVLIGTVPFNENLSENRTVCPHCGTVFNSEGHLQAFDVASLSGLFPNDLKIERTRIMYFVNWPQLNWKGKLVALVKKTLLMLGVHGANEKIYFVARKSAASRTAT